jgi:hypothetical protein
MSAIRDTLQYLGVEQYLLALLFLTSYALALGHFRTARGRVYSVACMLGAAGGFVAVTNPWEHGVLLVALALVGMGAFAGAVWAIWALLGWPLDAAPLEEPEEAPGPAAAPMIPARAVAAGLRTLLGRLPRKLARVTGGHQ